MKTRTSGSSRWTMGLAGLAIVLGCSKVKPQVDAGRGLDAPTNDGRITTLARAALGCKWVDEGIIGLDEKCPALLRWKAADEVRAGSASATLLAMLDDERAPARWLSGIVLGELERSIYLDPTGARTLIAAARRERNERAGRELGFAVGELDLAASQVEGDVRDIIAHHPVSFVRLAIVSRTLKRNPKMFELVEDLARTDKDMAVRRSAIKALRLAPADRRERAANLWVELAGDTNAEIADWAASKCAGSAEICSTRWDDLLTKMEAKATRCPSFMAYTLGTLYEQKTATEKQKNRIEKLTVAIVEAPSNEDIARGTALDALARMNAKAATALALKYKDSDNVYLSVQSAGVLSGESRGRDAGAENDPVGPR